MILEAALKYAERGWAVFPCDGKIPLTQHGFKNATIDQKQIKEWWSQWPKANIAIATGKKSELIVLDVDGEEGRESLKTLPKSETGPIVITGSGIHFYYKYPKKESIRTFIRKLPGLDLKADGGYVIAPPSRHSNGKTYQWHKDGPFIKPLPEAPKWLLELTEEKPQLLGTQIKSVFREGERNTQLTSYAGLLRRKGCTPDEIFEQLKIMNHSRCIPPLPETEIQNITQSISQYKPEDPLTIPNKVLLNEVKKIFDKWLYLENDYELLEVVFAAACDQMLSGDPVWLLLISPSGGTKTEIVRSLKGDTFYTLDSITPHTLISGKLTKTKEGQFKPIRGILPKIDNKILIIKDFTVILTKRREDRDEIFSQLRALYDGYIEHAFGNMDEPIRIKAKIGLIAACVPAIDKYQKVHILLGERFLKIRHKADRKKIVEKALQNQGQEIKMRQELETATERFLRGLDPKDINVKQEYLNQLTEIADATAYLRTPVSENFIPTVEYATRLSKQLLKLAKLLCIIRNKTEITLNEISTIQRVARDTCLPQRIKILQAIENPLAYTTRELAEKTGIPKSNIYRELNKLVRLGLGTHEREWTEHGQPNPDEDLWTLKIERFKKALFLETL